MCVFAAVGDQVNEDEIVGEVETDKVKFFTLKDVSVAYRQLTRLV